MYEGRALYPDGTSARDWGGHCCFCATNLSLIFHKQEHRVIEIFLLTLLGHATVQHLLSAVYGNSICSRNTPTKNTKGTNSFFYHWFPLPSLQEVLIHLCFTSGTNLPRPNTTSQVPRAEQHDQKKQTGSGQSFLSPRRKEKDPTHPASAPQVLLGSHRVRTGCL